MSIKNNQKPDTFGTIPVHQIYDQDTRYSVITFTSYIDYILPAKEAATIVACMQKAECCKREYNETLVTLKLDEPVTLTCVPISKINYQEAKIKALLQLQNPEEEKKI